MRDELSAYMDNALSDSERARVRAHIESCLDCRADYIELRATRQLMRDMPTISPPRAFTIRPEMVAPRTGFWQGLLSRRLSPALASGSALAFALLVLVLVGSYSSGRPSSASVALPQNFAPAAGPMAGETSVARNAAPSNESSPDGDQAALPTAAMARPAQPANPPAVQSSGTPLAGATTTAGAIDALAPPAQLPSKLAAPTPAAGAGVGASNIGSPTTTSLQNRPTGDADRSTQGYNPSENRVSDNSSPLLPALEMTLALLGVALAVGAVLARRRGE